MNNSILIVGGGTAGWMAALYLASKLTRNTQITLVESQQIGTIGVGEGSTPYLKNFFAELGIKEAEWMPACDATYKSGINFEDWTNYSEYSSYFHPFFNEFDKKPAEMFFYNSGLRRRGFDANATPDNYFTAAYIARQHRVPVPHTDPGFPIDYAYHFDATKLGEFLKTKAKAKGVNHQFGNVTSVEVTKQTQIKRVHTDTGQPFAADLFIDCSGFKSLLLQKTLKQPFVSYKETLFNDAAVAIQTPAPCPHIYKTQTISKALSSGWMWNIPLTSRWGNGYVYSSAHIDEHEATKELLKALNLEECEDIEPRHLKMKVGRVKQHWYQNCVGIGLSQGFIEPLEATALMLVQFAIQNLTTVLNQEVISSQHVNQYNNELNRLFDGVRDYVSLHYLLNTRKDSQYWWDVRENTKMSEVVKHLLKAWDRGEDFEAALKKVEREQVYLRPSWYCILSGMGRHGDYLQATPKKGPVDISIRYCQKTVEKHFPLIGEFKFPPPT